MSIQVLYTLPQAAEILGLTRARVGQLCDEMKLGKRFGRVRLISPSELQKLKDRPDGRGKWKQTPRQ